MIVNPETHPDDTECQSLNIRPERAEIGTEERRQHVDSLVDQVNRRASRGRFGVHGVVGVHKVRDVGDICGEGQNSVFGKTSVPRWHITYERLPGCCRSVTVWRGGHHRYLGSL